MITRIISINNVGSYKNFVCHGLGDFKKLNLIYGENGSGKTIFSKIISIFSNKEEASYKAELVAELFAIDSKVKINIENLEVEFTGDNYPNYSIYVFNSSFVSNNLNDGSLQHVKKFDFSNTKVQSAEITKLMDDINENLKQIGDKKNGLINKLDNMNKILQSQEKVIRAEFNNNILGKQLKNINDAFKFSNRNIDSINTDLLAKIKEYNIASKENFENDIEKFKMLELKKINFDINKLRNILERQIDLNAKESVTNKIKEINEAMDSGQANEWLEKGTKLLAKRRNNNHNVCILCNSNIESSIDSIINDYMSYFDKEYDELKLSSDNFLSELANIVDDIKDRRYRIVNELTSKYSFLFPENQISDDIESATKRIIDSTSVIKKKIEYKKEDPKNKIEIDDECLESFEFYNLIIQDYIIKSDILSEYFQKGTNADRLVDYIKDLYIEKYGALIQNSLNDKEPLKTKAKIEKDIEQLILYNNTKQESITNEFKKLKLESKYINEYLIKLNINRFTVDIKDTLEVKYMSGQSKKSLKHSLSEGEKTTLAFAYFLSKIKAETDGDLTETIIYIDDPISSLDEDRIFYTCNAIQKEFSKSKQLFVSSHDLKFLRILLTFLQFTYQEDIMTYQIRNNKESQFICNPSYLSNFNSSYYEKLKNILDYYYSEELRDELSNLLPNSIRVVLETFFSFKFGYIKKLKANGVEVIGISPGLSDIFKTLKKNEEKVKKLISELKDFDGINNENFLLELDYIIVHLTNIFSHGGISVIDYTNPPVTETELVSISKKTLSIMQFLDGLCMNAIMETIYGGIDTYR